jgi:hypothetical protein
VTTLRRTAIVVVAAVIVAACAGGSALSSSPGATNPLPAVTPTGTATGPSSEPSAIGRPSLAPSATPAPAPRAEIVIADATVAGALGTYTIDDTGSDSPWLPFDTLPSVGLGVAETPAVRFVDGVAIGQFQVEIAAATDTAGSAPREAPGGMLAADGRSFTIGPLPAGRWVLVARVFRADRRGDGLTYWAVTVR